MKYFQNKNMYVTATSWQWCQTNRQLSKLWDKTTCRIQECLYKKRPNILLTAAMPIRLVKSLQTHHAESILELPENLHLFLIISFITVFGF